MSGEEAAMGLSVHSASFGDSDPVPERYAMGVPADPGHAAPAGGNLSPHLAWSGAPAATRSFAILVVDPLVPIDGSDVGIEGRVIPADAARHDFAHWVVVDVPPEVTELAEGAGSDGVTPRGKRTGPTSFGGVAGRNDFTDFLAGDPDMAGTYGGYDGPFPPWNDERVHRYAFTVVALDVPTLGLSGDFGLAEARRALEGHVLGSAEWWGTYTLNPAFRTT